MTKLNSKIPEGPLKDKWTNFIDKQKKSDPFYKRLKILSRKQDKMKEMLSDLESKTSETHEIATEIKADTAKILLDMSQVISLLDILTDNIKRLKPVSYNMKKPGTKKQVAKANPNFNLTLNTSGVSKTEIIDTIIETDQVREEFYNRKHTGFIAQELQEVFPEMVYENNDGLLSVDYIALIPVMVAALKEQQQQMEVQQAEIEGLKEELLEIKGNKNKSRYSIR